MDNDIFSYYSQHETDVYTFYMIPKELFSNDNYKKMSSDAKLLYVLLNDRNQLSVKNNWVDAKGHIFIIFTREEAQNLLNFSDKNATKTFKELKEFNLIKEVRQGLNKPNIIYVGKIKPSNPLNSTEPKILRFQNRKNYDSRTEDFTIQKAKNLRLNNTYFNKTDFNKTDLNNNYSDSQKVEVKSKKKSVVAISPDTEILIENFKTIYKANLNPKHTQRLVDTKGIEVVKEYMSEFNDYIDGKNISDLGAYFYKCVMEEYTKPVSKKVTPTVPQYADFDQRHYEAEEFDKFYANMDD